MPDIPCWETALRASASARSTPSSIGSTEAIPTSRWGAVATTSASAALSTRTPGTERATITATLMPARSISATKLLASGVRVK